MNPNVILPATIVTVMGGMMLASFGLSGSVMLLLAAAWIASMAICGQQDQYVVLRRRSGSRRFCKVGGFRG